MESLDLIYKNGHFYDLQSKKRVMIADGAKINLSAPAACFRPFAPVGKHPLKVLTSEEKDKSIRNEQELSTYRKIFDRGKFLYFAIHRYDDKKKVAIHEFKVELLEELYLLLKKNWGRQEERLYDCACVVRENTTGTIDYFEEIHAESLNEIYKCTFVHYFGNAGNPACNAIDRFYDLAGIEESTIGRFRNSDNK
ncbi:MAG: hypothetical protein Q8927_18845 [Bacteroidota bacterium]|nr:hypothetical protein [Bacteroidota bacterium]MDP4218264.1 hypothetical protein [Bacteroidota bacterium]MDP4260819.1 hypothetical protein [Bacteroidota bacterium]